MKKIIYYLFLTILCIFTLGCSNKTIYGNNDEQILNYLKTCKSLNDYRVSKFEIVDTLYIDNAKVVGFLSNSYHGIIIYEKDKNDNYVYKSLESHGENDTSGLSIDRISYNTFGDFKDGDIGWIVFSYGATTSKVELTINNTYKLSSDLNLDEPSLTLIPENIPKQDSKAIKVNFKYYDFNNNEYNLPERVKLW